MIWKAVPRFPLYEVSDEGEVRHIRRPNKFLKKQVVNKYHQISLYADGVQMERRVHYLVLLAFVGERPEGLQTAHLDGDPFNNRLTNLLYATPKENTSHKYLHGTMPMGSRHHAALLTEKQVLTIRRVYRRYDRKNNSVRLAAKYGVSKSTIQAVIKRQNWAHL